MFRNLNGEMSRRGLTRKELAMKMGSTPNTLTRKMNGSVEFTLKEVYQIRDILNSLFPLGKNMDLDMLFEKSEYPNATHIN